MKKEIIFFQGEEILNKFDEKRIFGKELTNAQNKYIFSIPVRMKANKVI